VFESNKTKKGLNTIAKSGKVIYAWGVRTLVKFIQSD